ncbi:O-antigen ligase family protein [Paenibacillus sp. CC-CFT747]|nr:O-antigen ligase family protein [Paenibacillus sp. CC-CFT747]
MIRDYWLRGAGGGGWSVQYYQYASKDYYVKYVHNQYLQVALDIGVFGLIVFFNSCVLLPCIEQVEKSKPA